MRNIRREKERNNKISRSREKRRKHKSRERGKETDIKLENNEKIFDYPGK
jgi:hypothetical protein